MFQNNLTFNIVTFTGVCALLYIMYLLYKYPNRYGFDKIILYFGLIVCLMLFGNKYNSGMRSIILSFLIFVSVKFFESVN